MKTINAITSSLLAILMVTCMAACKGNKSGSKGQEQETNVSAQASVSSDNNIVDPTSKADTLNIAQQYLLDLNTIANEVSDELNDIKQIQNTLSSTKLEKETPSQRAKLRNDILLIKNSIKEHQKAVAEIETKFNDIEESGSIDELSKTEIVQTIANIKHQLAKQKILVSELSSKLALVTNKPKVNTEPTDSLELKNNDDAGNKQVTVQENTMKQEDIEILNEELNECYFCIGTESELKSQKIIESGFLKRTKIMQSSNVMLAYFIKADKRTLNEITIASENIKILTEHAPESFSIEVDDGTTVIKILDPEMFWEYTNYLVVQTD